MSETGPRHFGRYCFLLLAIGALVRAGICFLPCDFSSPSGYQCASYYLLLPAKSPHTVTARLAFGEGVRAANRLDFLTFRSEKFTVDRNGYRNLPSTTSPSILLYGSSFSLGMSLNDEDTLAAQLDRRPGPVVYNTSNVLATSLSAGEILAAQKSLGISHGWVLLELLNRAAYSYSPSRPQSEPGTAMASLHSLERRVRNPAALTFASSLLNLRLHNGSLLPNPNRSAFIEKELVNGRRMLFFSDDAAFFNHPAAPDVTTAAVVRLRKALLDAGFKLAVLLVPTGYSVYYPLLRDGNGPDNGERYIKELTSELVEKDIPVLNGMPLLRAAAASGLPSGNLVYWPDDAHWNPLGVETIAAAAAPWLATLTGVKAQ